MEAKLRELKQRLSQITDIERANGVLFWDQTTYMPPGGGAARGRQMATLTGLEHQKQSAPELGKLLDALESAADELSLEDAALVRIARRDFDHAVRIPAALLEEFSRHSAEAFQVWAKARPENDFETARPYLEKTLDLSRQLAECFPGYDHIADPLIDDNDYGVKAADVRRIFAELREELVPLVKAITEQPLVDDSCVRRVFPEGVQWAFGEKVVRDYGYDFQRGRVDKAPHPFMTKFSIGDVRMTTRFTENYLVDGLFSMLHEAGHALYEQGVNPDFEGLPLAQGASSGVHESQSRLWENLVGRSRGFWHHYYPQLQEAFPGVLDDVSMDEFYRAINKVEKTFIRVDADEVTYNLHVMMRFDFELAMLEGKLAVKDLPDAWNARFEADFGITPPDYKDGCMQDIHWFGGVIGGAFQGYTLGNILSAAFYEATVRAEPDIPDDIAEGRFDRLHGWLKEHIYQYGRVYLPDDLTERVTGQPMSIKPYIAYLNRKYGEIYGL